MNSKILNILLEAGFGAATMLFGIITILSLLSLSEKYKYYIEESKWKFAILFLSLGGFAWFMVWYFIVFFDLFEYLKIS
jgi:hypothetical protein